MGVSIAVYRCRIGTFQSRNSVLSTRKNSCSSMSSRSSSSIFAFLTILLSCSFVLAHSIHISRSIHFNVKPPTYPTTSAWTPSTCPTGCQPSHSCCPPAWIPPWPPPKYTNPHILSQTFSASLEGSTGSGNYSFPSTLTAPPSWLTRTQRNSIMKSVNGKGAERKRD